jgi:hypothetical protein
MFMTSEWWYHIKDHSYLLIMLNDLKCSWQVNDPYLVIHVLSKMTQMILMIIIHILSKVIRTFRIMNDHSCLLIMLNDLNRRLIVSDDHDKWMMISHQGSFMSDDNESQWWYHIKDHSYLLIILNDDISSGWSCWMILTDD